MKTWCPVVCQDSTRVAGIVRAGNSLLVRLETPTNKGVLHTEVLQSFREMRDPFVLAEIFRELADKLEVAANQDAC